jgi:hypothetical protein
MAVPGQEVLILEVRYIEAPIPLPSNDGFYALGVLGIRQRQGGFLFMGFTLCF